MGAVSTPLALTPRGRRHFLRPAPCVRRHVLICRPGTEQLELRAPLPGCSLHHVCFKGSLPRWPAVCFGFSKRAAAGGVRGTRGGETLALNSLRRARLLLPPPPLRTCPVPDARLKQPVRF